MFTIILITILVEALLGSLVAREHAMNREVSGSWSCGPKVAHSRR